MTPQLQTHTHAHGHAHTHAHTHARTHARTHTLTAHTLWIVQAHGAAPMACSKGSCAHCTSAAPFVASPCIIRGAPWLPYSVKAPSKLNKLRLGLPLSWQEVGNAPLWNNRNNRVLTAENKSITCRYFIVRPVLRVRDLIDSVSSSYTLTRQTRGMRKLRATFWLHKLQATLPAACPSKGLGIPFAGREYDNSTLF